MSKAATRSAVAAFLLAAVAAALVPVLGQARDPMQHGGPAFPGWPTHYEGRALTPMPLTQREAAFVRDFPGRVARFSDGSREIVIRWVGAPTRRLHSAADCLRGISYAIAPLPVRLDAAGNAMGCFRASDPSNVMTVCEVIRDEQGGSWPDVSAWYWNALFGTTRAAWWSFVVAERR
jgi:hypothetical protein